MSKAIASYEAKSSSVQDLLRFAFDGVEIRAVDRGGNPWFVGKDVCAVLGHGNPKQALSRLPDTARATIKIPDALGREQPTTIVSIVGVIRLVMTSRVEGAERFQAWVTDEVLPSIYKTGTYGADARVSELEAQLWARAEQVSALTAALATRPLTVSEADLSALTSEVQRLSAQVTALEQRLLPAPVTDGPVACASGRVVLKAGKPVEVHACLGEPDDLETVAAAFARAYPGFHLAPSADMKPDWQWHRVHAVVAVAAGPAPTREMVERRVGRIVRDADGQERTIRTVLGADTIAISNEALRLGYVVGAWRRRAGVLQAPILRTTQPRREPGQPGVFVVRSVPVLGSVDRRGVVSC